MLFEHASRKNDVLFDIGARVINYLYFIREYYLLFCKEIINIAKSYG
jgi:hypothetical protein